MRYREILESVSQHRQRVQPELLNMLAVKSQYDKDIQKLKAEKPKPEYTKKDAISVYTLLLQTDNVKHWSETHDKNWAFQHSRWFNAKMPPELVQEIRLDPRWQEIVLKIWDRAEEAWSRGLPGLYDITSRTLYADLNDLFREYQKKYGIDKTGRRVPN